MGRRRTGGWWARRRGRLAVAVVSALVLSALSVLAGSAPASDDEVTALAPVEGVRVGVWPGMYVALGDSFAAGPAIPRQVVESGGCQRSDHNYPHLVARALGLTLRDVTCSGAETVHMTSPQDVRPAPGVPQLDALGPQTRVVTLGIGSNDIGFAEVVATCITIFPWETPCRDRYLAGGADELSHRIRQTAPKVVAVLAEIRRRSPDAAVVVVGYPSIVPEQGYGCWPSLPFAYDDVPYLRAKHEELNDMLAAEAEAAGATFVDTYEPSEGRDACGLPSERWVEPLAPLVPASPMHPNATGMGGMAAEVVDEVSDSTGIAAA